MRKHVILSWRRRRFLGAVSRVCTMVLVPLLIWFLQPSDDRKQVRPQLCQAALPLLGVIFIITMFTQFVVEVVTDKELLMRYVQQIAGVSNVAYWVSYYLFYFLLTTFSAVLYLLCVMV